MGIEIAVSKPLRANVAKGTSECELEPPSRRHWATIVAPFQLA